MYVYIYIYIHARIWKVKKDRIITQRTDLLLVFFLLSFSFIARCRRRRRCIESRMLHLYTYIIVTTILNRCRRREKRHNGVKSRCGYFIYTRTYINTRVHRQRLSSVMCMSERYAAALSYGGPGKSKNVHNRLRFDKSDDCKRERLTRVS